jgi:hypothetical protein
MSFKKKTVWFWFQKDSVLFSWHIIYKNMARFFGILLFLIVLTLTLTSSNYYMSPLSLSVCFSY